MFSICLQAFFHHIFLYKNRYIISIIFNLNTTIYCHQYLTKTNNIYKNESLFNRYMDTTNPAIKKILETQLQEIYQEKYIKSEIQTIMQFPFRENQYIVTYNLKLKDSYPVVRAKIVVDTETEELKLYDPGLL